MPKFYKTDLLFAGLKCGLLINELLVVLNIWFSTNSQENFVLKNLINGLCMFVNGIIFYYFENGLSFVRNYPAHAQAHTPQKKKWAAEGIHILRTHTKRKQYK